MGFLQRLHRLTVARIEAALSTVEDPEILYPQLLREMEGKVRLATEAEAKAMASVKGTQRDIEQLTKKIERMKKGAELAMGKGDGTPVTEACGSRAAGLRDEFRQGYGIIC